MTGRFIDVTMIPLGGASDGMFPSCHLYLFHRTAEKPFVVMIDTGQAPGVKVLPDQLNLEAAGRGSRLVPAFYLMKEMGLEPDAILITHTHLDHVGSLMFARLLFPNTPIYMAPEAVPSARILLFDSLRLIKETRDPEIQEAWKCARFPYDIADLDRLCNGIRKIEGPALLLCEGLVLKQYHAGHILGARMFEFEVTVGNKKKHILHTGDVSLHKQMLLRGADIPHLPDAALVCEATNLGTDYNRKIELVRFFTRTREVLEGGGIVLLPTFPQFRGQEVMETFLSTSLSQKYPIFAYGPLFSDFTEAYRAMLPRARFCKMRVRGERFDRDRGIPGWHNHMRYVMNKGDPAIVLASGGMGSGASAACIETMAGHKDPKDAIFITGYPAPGTLNNALLTVASSDNPSERLVMISNGKHENPCDVGNLQIERFYMSGHAYHKSELEVFWRTVEPSKIVLVHGDKPVVDEYVEKNPTFGGVPFVKTAVGKEIELFA